jgi:electron transport complex protein RnfC
MGKFLKGLKLPHRKNTKDMAAEAITPPEKVVLSTAMHIGKPSTVTVKVGDHVDIGTLVATESGVISAPLHASISGTVKKVSDEILSNGTTSMAIEIESDGNMTVDSSIKPPKIENKKDLVEAIKNSGIIGLGGAGFPTHVKFNVEDGVKVEELIINGAECEPYITSDTRVMVEKSDDILYAIDTITKILGIEKVIIGIEENKPKAIAAMRGIAEKNEKISVKVLPSLYPQGGEKVLIYHTTGKVVKEGSLPISVGCIVSNSTTVASMGRFFKTGMPLVNKVVTVDGSAVKNPKNVIVPVGTAIRDVFDFCGGFKEDPLKILYGGPMMGISVPSLDNSVLKNTNALLALTEADITPIKTTNCIRCGACLNQCPFGINPAEISRAYDKKDVEALKKIGATLCMECGCCSYVCPANRPLVQTNRLAKAFIRKQGK